jgi:hypothetical protein
VQHFSAVCAMSHAERVKILLKDSGLPPLLAVAARPVTRPTTNRSRADIEAFDLTAVLPPTPA